MAEADRAAFQRVADELRAKIQSGELAEGQQLPTRRAMALRYDISYATTGRVLEILKGEGLITTATAAGCRVRQSPKIVRRSPARLAADQWGRGESIQQADTGPRVTAIDVMVVEVPAPELAAEALGISADTLVLARSRRYVVNGRPVQLATSYLPTDLTRGTLIEREDSGPGGTYARLADQGWAPTRFSERIRRHRAGDYERSQLELSASEWVYEIVRHAYAEDRCVEVNRMLLDPSVYELEYNFTA